MDLSANEQFGGGTDLFMAAMWYDDDDAGLFGEGMKLLVALRETNSSAFRFDGSWFGQPGTVLIDRYAGTPRLRELIDAGLSWHEVAGAFSAEARTFEAARKPFLLYD